MYYKYICRVESEKHECRLVRETRYTKSCERDTTHAEFQETLGVVAHRVEDT